MLAIPTEETTLLRQIRALQTYAEACRLAESLAKSERFLLAAEAFNVAYQLTKIDAEKGYALHRQALMYFYGDVLARAMQLFQKTAELGERTGNLSLRIEALSGHAGIMTELGRRLEAAKTLENAIQLGKKLHGRNPDDAGRRQMLRMHYNMAIAYRMIENSNGLKTTLSATETYLSESDPPFMFGYFGQLSGVLARLEGDFEKSRRLLDAAFLNIDSAPSTLFKLNLLYELVLTYEALGDGEAALKKAREMMRLASTLDDPIDFILPKTREAYARALSASGQHREAASESLEAYKMLKAEQQERLTSELLWLNDLYEKEVRNRELEMLRQDAEIKDLVISQQKYLVTFVVAIVVAFLFFAMLVARRRKEREAFHAAIARVEAQRDERLRIARELHDSILQGVLAISIQSQRAWNWAQENNEKMMSALDKLRDLARATALEGRRAIENYRSELRESSLQKLIDDMQTVVGSSLLNLDVPGKSSSAWSRSFPYDINAICIEAARNSVQHAAATTISVSVNYSDECWFIRIEDNGKGFDIGKRFRGHWGLVGMKERAAAVGAEFSMTSNSSGTKIQLLLDEKKAASEFESYPY